MKEMLKKYQEGTKIITVSPEALSLYARTNGGRFIRLEDNKVSYRTQKEFNEDAFVYVRVKGKYYPVVEAAKLSVCARGHCTFHIDINEKNALAISAFLETCIKERNASNLQVVLQNDRCLGIMSNRYTYVPVADFVDNVLDVCSKSYPNCTISTVDIDDTHVTVDIDTHVQKQVAKRDNDLFIRVTNSINGHTGLSITPMLKGKRVIEFVDESFYSVHKQTIPLEEGIEAMFTNLENSAKVMNNWSLYEVQNPLIFVVNLVKKLNKLNQHLSTNEMDDAGDEFKKVFKAFKKGKKIPKEFTSDLTNLIDAQASMLGKKYTAYEIIENMLDMAEALPNKTDAERIKKTILRFVQINKFEELDKI